MPEIFIDGVAVQAEEQQTVMQAAQAHGFMIPALCWHPQLSAPGNCRVCMVEVQSDSGGWLDIACNMPVTSGMRVLTDSERVRARRKETLQFMTLNHPVDCGICDKAGECLLQDYHYEFNGAPSVSHEPKVQASKHFELSTRIVLDNERCILCSRCVRFTREISKSHALGIQQRGDHSLIRPVEDGAFEGDPYSDNVIDICPVGALLSRTSLHQTRVWYLQPTASVCPGCERGCHIDIWHRKSEWQLKAPGARPHKRIERITPRQCAVVNGAWICNKGRDLAQHFERARAEQAMALGRSVALPVAIALAGALIAAARRPVALLSNWGSNEELAAFQQALAPRFQCLIKPDCLPAPGERLQDELLIQPDKNPNSATVRALFDARISDVSGPLAPDADLVLIWGEGCDTSQLPRGAKRIVLASYAQPENSHADVFLPISVMTERAGHYTNFQGVVSAFEACFARSVGVADAQDLFVALEAAAAAMLATTLAPSS